MKLYFRNLRLLLFIYIAGLIIFFLFRLTLLVTQWDQAAILPDRSGLLIQSFLMGLRFDNVISCYIIILPVVIYSIAALFNYNSSGLHQFIAIYLSILYGLSFIVCTGDIPYFSYFFKHLNASIFNWAGEEKFVTEMILKDKSSLLYVIIALIIPIIFTCFVFFLSKKNHSNKNRIKAGNISDKLKITACLIVLVFACILGMRGRLAVKSPIRVGTAFFSSYPFPNQLSLNPVFYLLRSIIDSQKDEKLALHFMPDQEAIANVKNYFGITNPDNSSPIARIQTGEEEKKYNVVLILMEGISSYHLEKNGGTSYLPFLDSLTNNSLYFDNCYSAGIHTMNGVCGAIFSQPSLLQQHPFKATEMPIYAGFPNVLSNNGYQTAYFTTHDDQFDNIGGVMKANHIELLMSQKDYPNDRVLSNLGVPDDYMFERAITELNSMSQKDQPFFAAMLTASNHSPIRVPEYFSPQPGDEKIQILEYTNWALEKFFEMAKKESWYDHTIFVLCSDHGAIIGSQLYDMPVSYNHVPMFIISPEITEPYVYSEPAGQIDIFPTIMGMLGITFTNNTFGEDLLNTKREYIFFSADDVVGCVNDSLLYTYHTDGREYLYNYKQDSPTNLIKEHESQASNMKKYVLSMMQTAQYMVQNKLMK